MKRIEALGAIELLAGDDLMAASLGNMSHTAAGDLVEVIGQLRHSVAGELQHFEAPRSWMGSEGVNIFGLLLQLMKVVEKLAEATASHTHGSGPEPSNNKLIIEEKNTAKSLQTSLENIIE